MNHFVRKRCKHIISFSLMLFLFCNYLSATPDCPIVTGRFQNPDGTTSVNSSTGWFLDASNVSGSSIFWVKSNRLHAQELGGEGIWYSKVFSTAGYSDFKVAVKVSSEGDMNSSEYVKIYYKINGGTATLLDQRTGNFGTIDFTSPVLTGNNVQLIVKIYNYNNGGSQTSKYYIEEYRVFKEHGPCGAPGNISVSATAANGGVITCTNPSTTLSASSTASGVSYSWSGPGGFTSTSQNPVVSTAGTYNVTGTNSTGSGSASVTITDTRSTPDLTATGGALGCSATSVTLNASSSAAGVQYSWAGPGGFTSNSQNPVVNTTGTYTVTVTKPDNGCTASQAVQVTGTSTTVTNFWNENFSLANGTTIDTGSTAWTTESTGTGTYSVQNNEFKTSYSGGSEGKWYSQVIDISGKSNVVLSVDLRSETAGGSDFFESDDYIRVYYKLNGGAETLVYEDFAGINSTTTGTASIAVASANLNGSSLQVIIKTRNSDPTERYFFDNVKLSSTENSSVPANVTATNNGPLTCDFREATLTGNSTTPGVTYLWTGPFGFTSTSAITTTGDLGNYTLLVTNPATGCTASVITSLLDPCKGERRTTFSQPVTADTEEPTDNSLAYKMYPNPSNGKAYIEFKYPQSATVSIGIYNIMGACEKVLFNNTVTPNQVYKLEVNGSKFNSGTYYCVMKIDGKVYTRKLMLIK